MIVTSQFSAHVLMGYIFQTPSYLENPRHISDHSRESQIVCQKGQKESLCLQVRN